MTRILGHNYIGGQRSAAGAVKLQSVDASTGEALPHDFYQATLEEVDAAAKAAAAAYPAYRSLSAERRAQFLDAIADELDALGDDFVAVVCRETALPAGRIQGERGRTSGQMRLFAKVLRRGDFYGARIDRALPDRQAAAASGPASVPHRSRAGRRVWRQQLSAGLFHCRRRHRFGPGRRLPGGVQGPQRPHGNRRLGRRRR